jgi:hypothetical protein
MIILNTITDVLRVTPSSANLVEVTVFFADTTATTAAGGRQLTSIAAAAVTTVLGSPAAATERVVKYLSIQAVGGANNIGVSIETPTVFRIFGNPTNSIALAVGETLHYTDTDGWRKMNAAGKTVLDVPVAAGASTPSGTGFRHVTAGVEDAASKLVDTADVNANQITYAKIQQGATNTIPANATAGAANFADLSVGANTVVGRVGGNIVAAALVNAQITANTITHASEAQPAANTSAGNWTAGAANMADNAVAVQSAIIRAAGNIFAAAATAAQHLRRSIAGGDLGFSALEVGAMGTPITANAAASAATTNLSCCTFTTVANSLVAGSVFLFSGWYSYLHTAATTPTLTAEILVNGAVVATGILTPIATAATFSGRIDGILTIRTTGAGGTAMAQVHHDANFSGVGSVDGSVNTATFAIDTTAARSLELRVRMTTAVASNTLTVTNGYIERLL